MEPDALPFPVIRPNGSSILRRLAGIGAALALALCLQPVSAQNVRPPPPPKWTGSVAAGLSLTKGNSDTTLLTLSGRLGKKWDMNEVSMGADAAYGQSDGEENNETIGGFGQYNRLLTERLYAFGRIDALHDGISGLDYRLTFSVGLGYYLIKETNSTFSVEIGPGYVMERQQGTGTNGVSVKNYATIRLGEKFEHKFNDRVRVWQSIEVLPQIDHVQNFVANAEVGVESALSKSWSLRVVLQDTYDNEPATGREKNDVKLVAGVGWKF